MPKIWHCLCINQHGSCRTFEFLTFCRSCNLDFDGVGPLAASVIVVTVEAGRFDRRAALMAEELLSALRCFAGPMFIAAILSTVRAIKIFESCSAAAALARTDALAIVVS